MAVFGLDLGVLVAQIVNFALLLTLLTLLLYRPVTKVLRERSERIAKGLADAAAAEVRAAQADAEYAKRIQEAQSEAQAIVAQAKQSAEKERQAILAIAQAEAQALRKRAQEEIEHERHEAIVALQGQVADLALQAAGQVLGHAVDEAEHRRLVQDFVRHLEETP